MGKEKIILIGLDGCDFRILKPLIEKGYLPTFSELLKNGCHGTLISTLPPNTLPAWTSIFTGVNPGKHGITDFIIKENGQYNIANTRYRMVDSLWTILSRRNVEQIIINEPVTFPPEKIKGIMLTGFLTPLQERRKNFAYPSSVMDEIEKVSNGYKTELPFGFEEIIAKSKDKGFQLISEVAENIIRTTKYLSKNYDWQLLATIITSTDRLQHFYFNDFEYISSHYKLLDNFLNEVISHEAEANILIVSDHGFGPLEKCFYINTWLKDQGLASENRNLLNVTLSKFGITYPKLVSMLMKMKLYNFLAKITPISVKRSIPTDSYSATIDFINSKIIYPSINGGLFINNPNINKDVSTLVKALLSITFNGENPIKHIYFRKEVLWGPYAYRGADIYLVPKYGYEISPRLVPLYLSPPLKFGDIRSGTHRPEGIFIAYGPDISRNIQLKEPLFTWDVAPLILHMLGLPIPSYMDGCVRKEIFREGSEPAVNFVKYEYGIGREWVKSRLNKLRKKVV
ncbi:MAG: alkaline phosphatase family protein [Candidatus Verstraetearchaeota archaeon]|nr:alkaline phosphatase family protein [Candidatus Verstraetearchaeota archaeon]